MREDEVRAAAAAALRETERRVDSDAAWSAFAERAGISTEAVPARRWPMMAAAAAVIALLVGIGVMALRDDGAIRVGPATQPPAVTTGSPTPTTSPATSPTTSRAPTTAAPVTAPPPWDTSPLATATRVAAGPDGVLLGLPDGTWVPTEMTDPATGPAYLVGKFVVQQDLDGVTGSEPSRAITILSKDGTNVPGLGYPLTEDLLDVGWVDRRPTMLVTKPLDAGDQGTAYIVSLLDAQDVTQHHQLGRGDDTLNYVPVLDGGVGDTAVAVLRDTGDGTTALQVLPYDGDTASIELPAGTWSLDVDATTARVWAISAGDEPDSFRIDVHEFDLGTLAESSGSIPLPEFAMRGACTWARFDGTTLTCDRETFDVTNGWRPIEGPAGTIVTARRGPLPADVDPVRDGFRPWVDESVCQPVATRSSGLRRHSREYVPFTPLLAMTTWQFVGYPDLEWGGPFALVGVLVEPVVPEEGWPALGEPWSIAWEATTAARVSLPDQRQFYVRTWGFDQPMIEQLVGALAARPLDARIPGFDYDPDGGPAGMELVHEQLPGDTPVFELGSSHTLTCDVPPPLPNGRTRMAYRITSYTGPDIWKYFGVLDRSRPRDVGRRGDAVIIVNGASAGPGEPALPGPDASDIIEAPDQQWIELRDRPTTP